MSFCHFKLSVLLGGGETNPEPNNGYDHRAGTEIIASIGTRKSGFACSVLLYAVLQLVRATNIIVCNANKIEYCCDPGKKIIAKQIEECLFAHFRERTPINSIRVIRRAASKKLPETDVGLFKQFAQTFIWKSVFLEQFSWMIQRRYQIRC